MALTESNMLELGTQAPEFNLLNTVDGKTLSLDQARGKEATVIMFLCNHCPYVIHVNNAIVALANDYAAKDVNFVAISSNDVDKYPQDGPEKMKTHAQKTGYPFPYLYDETQIVAKDYDAACTPDFYVFDAELKLVYRGQMDGSRPGNGKANDGADLRAAIDAVLMGDEVSHIQRPSAGCNIKWK